MRAYDRNSKKFKDFVITRFKQFDIIDSDIAMAEMKESDNQWNRIVDLTLIPHSKSSFSEVIEFDYAMTDGQLSTQVRAALVGYMLNQWDVDFLENYQLNHNQYQLALKAREAIYAVGNADLVQGYQEIKNDHRKKTKRIGL